VFKIEQSFRGQWSQGYSKLGHLQIEIRTEGSELGHYPNGIGPRRHRNRVFYAFLWPGAITLRVTPAMAAGVTDKLWSIGDIVKVLEDWERACA
jgi:hypothetical protein